MSKNDLREVVLEQENIPKVDQMIYDYLKKEGYNPLSNSLSVSVLFQVGEEREELFEAFQCTRQKNKDSEPYKGYTNRMEGYTYMDTFTDWVCEALHIQIKKWPWNTDKKYCLTIGNEGWVSDDLAELEKHLFDFAMDEGFADSIKGLAGLMKPSVEFPVQAWDATGTRKVILKGPISPYMIRNYEDED